MTLKKVKTKPFDTDQHEIMALFFSGTMYDFLLLACIALKSKNGHYGYQDLPQREDHLVFRIVWLDAKRSPLVAFLILQMVVAHDAIDWSGVDSNKGLGWARVRIVCEHRMACVGSVR